MARHFTELVVWQLAEELRVVVLRLTGRRQFAADLKLHSQTEDAANSVCRNIAEGFGCGHIEFARFLVIARRSLNELQDALHAARLKGYVGDADLLPVHVLLRRIFPAASRLIAYLRKTPNPALPTRRDRV